MAKKTSKQRKCGQNDEEVHITETVVLLYKYMYTILFAILFEEDRQYTQLT